METDRIEALDVLRGVAILGTLGTNIWVFADQRGAAGFLDLPTPDSVAGVTELLLRFLSNGKFLALLSLMFGIGMELQYRSARKRGARWPGWHLWRAALLFFEGVVHYTLIFEFDVLIYYAIVSALVAFVIGRSERVISIWLWFQGLVFVTVIGLLTLAQHYRHVPLTIDGNGPSTTSWPAAVADRIVMAGTYRAEAVLVIPLGMFLFLLGSRLMRRGVLADSRQGQRLRNKLMQVGLGMGIPLNLITTFSGASWFFADRYVTAGFVSIGLLGLVTTLVHRLRGEPGPLRRGLISVGRVALSSYILQNLIAGILCYEWGFGLSSTFVSARPWWVIVLYLGVSALIMALSKLWLKWFSRGPVELLWQWAYLRPQRATVSRVERDSNRY
ncbi:DUF418 domain-containing protein [Amycolatopsis sp. cmx-11-32]|uniref:DUF418 domain-containing protein n=1 Tax=Amycolatopsis sp. cmx-11-32 TaxID=2785796 RepID=UPI0039E61CB7